MKKGNWAVSYFRLVEEIFGTGVSCSNCTGSYHNPVVGAFTSDNYRNFTTNLAARFTRLRDSYPDENDLQYLRKLCGELATQSNWQGAFAELSALDTFNYSLLDHPSFIYRPASMNILVENGRFVSGSRGSAQIDGCFTDSNVLYEVKSYSDNVRRLMAGVYEEVKSRFPKVSVWFMYEYQDEMNSEVIRSNRQAVIDELSSQLDETSKPRLVRSDVVKGLEHRINWGPEICVTEGSCSPYACAEREQARLFWHCDQFPADRSFLLVYVVLPWYNNLVSSFQDWNKTFYRALARRMFCAYREETRTLGELFPQLTTKELVRAVPANRAVRALSGIVFIEDDTILSECPDSSNTNVFLYANPNAEHLLAKSLFWDYAVCDLRCAVVDDFAHDNY